MTNEEKARELAIKSTKYIDDNGKEMYNAFVEAALQEMAEWKEQQMIEKACEWLNDNLASFWQCKLYDDITFIDDFKKVMEE